jgi:hypothetical protein
MDASRRSINVNEHADTIGKDIETLARFISIYCEQKHRDQEKSPIMASGKVGDYINHLGLHLCTDCRKLLLHAASKRIICPYNPKPSCKKCKTHCYGKGYRDQIREIMRFSGMFLIKRGKLGLIRKYLS